jgi:lysophospholipase L1-like esterase
MTRHTDKVYYKEELQKIAHQDFEKGQIVLLGDCVIENMNINKFFPNQLIYNNGICGDTTTLLFDSLYKRAIKYKPSKLFLSIGTNDLAYSDLSVKEIYENIIEIINTMKRRSKETEIYILTTLPVNPANYDFINRDLVDKIDNFEVNMLNYYIKNYARRNRIKVVDAYKHLKNDFDQLCLDYTTDGYHLNDMGYQRLSQLMQQYV